MPSIPEVGNTLFPAGFLVADIDFQVSWIVWPAVGGMSEPCLFGHWCFLSKSGNSGNSGNSDNGNRQQ